MSEEMMLATARALTEVIPEEDLSEDYVIPSLFDERIVPNMAEEVEEAPATAGWPGLFMKKISWKLLRNSLRPSGTRLFSRSSRSP